MRIEQNSMLPQGMIFIIFCYEHKVLKKEMNSSLNKNSLNSAHSLYEQMRMKQKYKFIEKKTVK